MLITQARWLTKYELAKIATPKASAPNTMTSERFMRLAQRIGSDNGEVTHLRIVSCDLRTLICAQQNARECQRGDGGKCESRA